MKSAGKAGQFFQSWISGEADLMLRVAFDENKAKCKISANKNFTATVGATPKMPGTVWLHCFFFAIWNFFASRFVDGWC